MDGSRAVDASAGSPGAALQRMAEASRDLLAPMRESEVVDVYSSPWVWLLLLAVLLLEYLRPAKPGQKVLSNGLFQDGVYFALSVAFRIGVLAFYVGLLRAVYDRHLSFLTLHAVEAWPLWSRVLLAILVVDFLGWFHHFVRHKIAPLWHFHAVHHAQREMNLFTDVRVHPLDRVASQTIQFVPLFMVDASFPAITAWVLFHQVWTKLCHANVRLAFGPLRYLLVTPQSHRIHHSFAARHTDRNFGVVFSIWDRLLGTHYEAVEEYPECGVADPGFPMESGRSPGALLGSTWAQFLYPFRQLGRSLSPSR